jgi:hypothetical protein
VLRQRLGRRRIGRRHADDERNSTSVRRGDRLDQHASLVRLQRLELARHPREHDAVDARADDEVDEPREVAEVGTPSRCLALMPAF